MNPTSTADTPVVLADVTKTFGSTTALTNVSWSPARGQVTALVGLNGAGKSTLMRIMTGLIRPTEGSVSVSRGTSRTLSAMIEAPALFAGLSARRNLEIHRTLTGSAPEAVGAVAELTQITDVLHRRAGQLSQGYRQRVAIAQALMGDPAVVLLDEPSNALDPEANLQLRALIRRLADEGVAVVVSSHLLRELEGTADVLTVLHEGRILYDGPFDAFVGRTSLRIRVQEADAIARLTLMLNADGIAVRPSSNAIHADPDGDNPDVTARRIFAAAATAGIDLVELSHVKPSLEEAFQSAISGVHS